MTRPLHYLEDEHGVAQPADDMDLIEWAQALEKADRSVARTRVGDVVVSTVFLGLDHNHAQVGAPLLYETMTFKHGDTSGEEVDGGFDRYVTREQALSGHEAIVEKWRNQKW